MKKAVPSTDSLVLFRNCQGIQARGTLLHLSRNTAVFEVYNPYSIVQLSEVLHDLQIVRGERSIYTGRAVVSNLVPTGLMVIVSATLVDPWSELNDLVPGQGLREELERCLQEWEASQAIRPSYRLAVHRLRAFQAEISRLLEQVDVAVGAEGVSRAPSMERELIQEIEGPIKPKMEEFFEIFEWEAGQIPPEEVVSHKAFVQRELHPLMLCAPFIHRSFSKPLGYAGDYEMVNMIIRDPWEGSTAYAKIMNAFVLRKDTAIAHQNRIDRLFDRLCSESQRVSQEGRPFRVLNVGCGPAVEVQRFIKNNPLSEFCEFHLLDFNQETIDYAKEKIHASIKESHRASQMEFHHKSIHDLLREAKERNSAVHEAYDMVYCAGLFDYLTDRICKRLLELFHGWTKPGGLVVSTNVHPDNPILHFMEYLLEWHLIYRDEKKMAQLALPFRNTLISKEETGLNVFLDIRK